VIGVIEKVLHERRTLETAPADLLATSQREPSTDFARMIEGLRAEIELRKRLIRSP
jgi:hypothetical protein